MVYTALFLGVLPAYWLEIAFDIRFALFPFHSVHFIPQSLAVYMPFARQILKALSHKPWVLVMDGSQAGRGCMVQLVGVLYQKRALLIAWLVYKGKKGHASAERHIQVLEKIIPVLPKDSQVVLLGDAEYDTTEMLAWIEKNTSWQYVLRTSPQIYVQTSKQSQLFETIPWRKVNFFT